MTVEVPWDAPLVFLHDSLLPNKSRINDVIMTCKRCSCLIFQRTIFDFQRSKKTNFSCQAEASHFWVHRVSFSSWCELVDTCLAENHPQLATMTRLSLLLILFGAVLALAQGQSPRLSASHQRELEYGGTSYRMYRAPGKYNMGSRKKKKCKKSDKKCRGGYCKHAN